MALLGLNKIKHWHNKLKSLAIAMNVNNGKNQSKIGKVETIYIHDDCHADRKKKRCRKNS